jgi:predicted RNase H-like HicB family nuclease
MTTDPIRYLILIEGDGSTNYSAWSPDVPGCVSSGETVEATVANMREAISGHLQSLAEYGDPIPDPTGPGVYIEQHAAAVA